MTTRPVTADALKVTHGFFTRVGGVSKGLYEGLNCGLGSDDEPSAVQTNRKIVMDAMQADTLFSVHQTHSPDVVLAEEIDPENRPKADAIVSCTPGQAIGVLTADCTPVLFADHAAGVIACAHAGWKGALAGVLENTVEAMVAQGADRSAIIAVAGPTISQRNYEVGAEFLERFEAEDPEALHFFANGVEAEKYQFDLPGFVLSRMRASGVSAIWTGHCTYEDEAKFFSFRRTTHRKEPDYGRQISIIRL